jgi:hypothetical protein
MRRFLTGPAATLAAVLLIAGCTGSDDTADEPTTTATPATTVAPPGTATTVATATTSDFTEVVFDGNGCTMSDPSTLPAGDRGFVITNNSDDVPTSDLYLVVASLHFGHVFQDLVDLQDEAGGPPNYYPHPSWLPHEPDIGVEYFDRPEVSTPELTDNQGLVAKILTEGNDAVYLYAGPYKGGPEPDRVWFCAPLEVTGAAPAVFGGSSHILKATFDGETVPQGPPDGCPELSEWRFEGSGTGTMMSTPYSGEFQYVHSHCSRWMTGPPDPERTTGRYVGKAEAGVDTITVHDEEDPAQLLGELFLEYQGTWVHEGDPPEFDMQYTIVGGTGLFEDASGHGQFFATGDIHWSGVISGSLHVDK